MCFWNMRLNFYIFVISCFILCDFVNSSSDSLYDIEWNSTSSDQITQNGEKEEIKHLFSTSDKIDNSDNSVIGNKANSNSESKPAMHEQAIISDDELKDGGKLESSNESDLDNSAIVKHDNVIIDLIAESGTITQEQVITSSELGVDNEVVNNLEVVERGKITLDVEESETLINAKKLKMCVIEWCGDGVKIVPVKKLVNCGNLQRYEELVPQQCCKNTKCLWGCMTTFFNLGTSFISFVREVAPIALLVAWLIQNGKINEIGGWVEAIKDGNFTI